jgi:hypothetical protein
LALHRAVVGYEVGPSDLIEALVAESVTSVEVRAKPEPKWTPSFLVQDGHRFSGAFASPALHAAIACLARFKAGGRGLENLLRLENEVEIHVGELLAELNDRRAWHELGCWGAGEYGEERLGMSRTAAWRRAAIARRLRQLPVVQCAYLEGAIGIEAAECIERALGPRAGATVQHAWVVRAREATVKRLKDDEALAIRDRLLQAQVPLPANDVAWQKFLRREPGRSWRAVLELGGDLLTKIETGQRDPDVFLRLRLPVDVGRGFAVALGQVRRCVSGPLPSGKIAAALKRRHRGLPAWLALLAMLEDYVATWDPQESSSIGLRTGRLSMYDSRVHIAQDLETSSCTDHAVELDVRKPHLPLHTMQGEHGGRAQCRGRAGSTSWRLGFHLGRGSATSAGYGGEGEA